MKLLIRKPLPQNQDIEVMVTDYKEPILPVNHGGFGWYGVQAYNDQGQLMCHECGGFYDHLGCHIRKHHLNRIEYKNKFGLLFQSNLSSAAAHEKNRILALERIAPVGKREALITRCKQLRRTTHRGANRGIAELVNRHDTCRAQLLRRLGELAIKYGKDISVMQVRAESTTLVGLLQREFGSFNEAKRLLRLQTREGGSRAKISRDVVIGDMVTFYNKYKRWPRMVDYRNKLLVCCDVVIRRMGGIGGLHQEAIELRGKQDTLRLMKDRIAQIATQIDMEYAGRSRR